MNTRNDRLIKELESLFSGWIDSPETILSAGKVIAGELMTSFTLAFNCCPHEDIFKREKRKSNLVNCKEQFASKTTKEDEAPHYDTNYLRKRLNKS